MFFSLLNIFVQEKAEGEILRLSECNKFDGMFSVVEKNKKLVGAVIASFANKRDFECVGLCMRHLDCKSINHQSKNNKCELLSKEKGDSGTTLERHKGWMQVETPKHPKKVC